MSILAPLLTAAAAAVAQPIPAPPVADPHAWQPTARYVDPGQDEPGYQQWYMAAPWRAAQVKSFNDYLTQWGVAGVVPTWQLLRTASDWRRCGAPAFELAPTSEWPNIVQTLRYIRDNVIPTVGPVEPVSVYRNPLLNSCAGGSPRSVHQHMQAVDLVPLRPITRAALMRDLCAMHARSGNPYRVGLGFYAFLRFHIDSHRFRKWGFSGAPEGEGCTGQVRLVAEPVAPPPEPAPVLEPVLTPVEPQLSR